MAEEGILLESGTNELELLEFVVGDQSYGINVAKIRELSPYQKPTFVPNAHDYVEGLFMPRDEIISVIDLAKVLGLPKDGLGDNRRDMYVITNFSGLHTAFHVQKVIGIHRISWSDISKPEATIAGNAASVATGIVKIDGKILIILDFEKIVGEINPEISLKVSTLVGLEDTNRHDVPILLAEDSALLLELLKKCLNQSGYTHLIPTMNGLEAWEKLEEIEKHGEIGKDVCCVITDIEMPQMDGHHLLKKIKTDPRFSGLPVIIFSSLINDEMRIKGEKLGADAQLSKPEIGQLVEKLDLFL